MSNKGRPQDDINSIAHRHYQSPLVGDGVKTEFALSHSVTRADDVMVFVAGALQHPATPGAANDYAIRGLTAGYKGDSNRIKFTAAPGAGAKIMFIVAGG